MSKEIKVIKTEDEHDCKICGYSYVISYQIKYNNNKGYGEIASVQCYHENATKLAHAYELFLIDQGYSIKREAI